jgi:hypothetical protein
MVRRSLPFLSHLISVYIVLVLIAASVIHLMTGIAWIGAFSTAAVGCVAKAIAVKVHDYFWFRRFPRH